VDLLLAEGLQHARQQLVLRIAARGIAHHALLFRQLALEVERVLPVEGGVLDRRRGLVLALLSDLRHGTAPGQEMGEFAIQCPRSEAGFKPPPSPPRRELAGARANGLMAQPILALGSYVIRSSEPPHWSSPKASEIKRRCERAPGCCRAS